MTSATISPQELQQNYAAAEEATHVGPVFIATNGQPRAVLIDISEYRRLSGAPGASLVGRSLVDLLSVPQEEYFDWEPTPLRLRLSGQAG